MITQLENDLFAMVRSIKFRRFRSSFQPALKRCYRYQIVVIFLCRCRYQQHEELIALSDHTITTLVTKKERNTWSFISLFLIHILSSIIIAKTSCA